MPAILFTTVGRWILPVLAAFGIVFSTGSTYDKVVKAVEELDKQAIELAENEHRITTLEADSKAILRNLDDIKIQQSQALDEIKEGLNRLDTKIDTNIRHQP